MVKTVGWRIHLRTVVSPTRWEDPKILYEIIAWRHNRRGGFSGVCKRPHFTLVRETTHAGYNVIIH